MLYQTSDLVLPQRTMILSKNSKEQAGGAVKLQQLIARTRFRVKSSEKCRLNGMQSLFGAQLCRRSQILNARTALTTVQSSERKIFS